MKGYWVKCIKCTQFEEFTEGKKYYVNAQGCITTNDGFTYVPAGGKDAVEWLHNNSDYRFEPCSNFNSLLEGR